MSLKKVTEPSWGVQVSENNAGVITRKGGQEKREENKCQSRRAEPGNEILKKSNTQKEGGGLNQEEKGETHAEAGQKSRGVAGDGDKGSGRAVGERAR